MKKAINFSRIIFCAIIVLVDQILFDPGFH